MNKKLMALAVAGALAAPAAAMAQVTISGGFRMSMSQHTITSVLPFAQQPAAALGGATASTASGRYNAAGTASNLSETRLSDNVSQIIFSATEDLGGGLKAIGRYEWRPTIDGAGNAALGGGLANGTSAATNFVGLESASMGTLRFGSITVFSGAGGTGSTYTADRGLAFASAVGISQQIGNGAVLAQGQLASASQLNFAQGRHTNAIVWNSPAMSGVSVDVVWSSQNAGEDSDLAVPAVGATQSARKGSMLVIGPKLAVGGLTAQYLYMDNKTDGQTLNAAASVTTWVGANTINGAGGSIRSNDIKAHKVWATYDFGNGWQATGIWTKATLINGYNGGLAQTNASGGNKLSEKNIAQAGVRYITGPYTLTADYTKGGDDKVATNAAGQTGNSGAKQISLGLMYELSKRTEVGFSYTKVTNDSLAANGPQDTANFALGGTGTRFANAGEGYTIWGGNITHKF